MENRIKRQKKKMFFLAIIGYFVGATLYELFGDGDSTFRFFAGALFAGLVDILIVLYDGWKYPEIKDKKRQLDKDERNIILNVKAAGFTITVVLFALAIILLISIIIKNKLIGYLSAGLYLFIFFLLIVSKAYWNKRM